MLEVLIFALAYAVKGGWHEKSGAWMCFKDASRLGWLLSCKALSTALIFAYCAFWLPEHFLTIPLAWLIGVAPSMGEEAGGVGRWGKAWGPYIEHFDRQFAIKKAVMRGVFTTAFMSVVLSNPWLLLAGSSFPLVYWLFQSVYWWLHKRDSWAYAEIAYGAIIGAAFTL